MNEMQMNPELIQEAKQKLQLQQQLQGIRWNGDRVNSSDQRIWRQHSHEDEWNYGCEDENFGYENHDDEDWNRSSHKLNKKRGSV
jgi:hypothetical protein